MKLSLDLNSRKLSLYVSNYENIVLAALRSVHHKILTNTNIYILLIIIIITNSALALHYKDVVNANYYVGGFPPVSFYLV